MRSKIHTCHCLMSSNQKGGISGTVLAGTYEVCYAFQSLEYCGILIFFEDQLQAVVCVGALCPHFFRIHSSLQAHILRSAYIYIFEKRSSSHSLRALATVFGLSSFGFEEYLKEIRNNMYCHLSLTHLGNLLL